MLRLSLAWLHLIALGVGLGAIIDRALILREPIAPAMLRRAFRADTTWGVAAVLWIGSGLWRLFAHTEKSTSYYLANDLFWTKMGLLAAVLVLEVWPMITLIRWRIALAHGQPPDASIATATAHRIAVISAVQAILVAGMVAAAVAMARGYGVRG